MAKILIYNGTTPQWIEIPNATVTPADGEIPATLEFDAVTELADSFQNNQESQDKIIELLTDPESNFIQNVAGDLLNNHLTDIIGPTGPRGESFQVDAAGQLNLQVIQEIESNQASEFDFYVYVVTDDLRDTEDLSQRLGGIDSGEGDAFVDLSSHVIMWNGDSWYDYGQFTGLQGPTGATGATGATGSTGPGVLVDLNYSQTSDEAANIIITEGDVIEGDPTVVSSQITTTGGPVQIIATGDANPLTALAWATLQLFRNDGESDVAIGKIVQVESSGENDNCPYALNYIDHPSAGTYTYKLKVIQMASANGFEFSENGSGHMTVVELKGVKGDDGSAFNASNYKFILNDNNNLIDSGVLIFNDVDGDSIDEETVWEDIRSISINRLDYDQANLDISLSKKYSLTLADIDNPEGNFANFVVNNINIQKETIDGYSYRNFRVFINRIWGNDPSINQLIICHSNDNPDIFLKYPHNTNIDDFSLTGLTLQSSTVAMVNVYGNSSTQPISEETLLNFFYSFVDNVLYTNDNLNNIQAIRSNFYDEVKFNNLINNFSNDPNSSDRLLFDTQFDFEWGRNYISDGSDDQYDSGNYINTNLRKEIYYGELDEDGFGAIVTGNESDQSFGLNSSYVTLYNNFIFAIIATDAKITDLHYSGNLGADNNQFSRKKLISNSYTKYFEFYNLNLNKSSETCTFLNDTIFNLELNVIDDAEEKSTWNNPGRQDNDPDNFWKIKNKSGGNYVIFPGNVIYEPDNSWNNIVVPAFNLDSSHNEVEYISATATEAVTTFMNTLSYSQLSVTINNGSTWYPVDSWSINNGIINFSINETITYDIVDEQNVNYVTGPALIKWTVVENAFIPTWWDNNLQIDRFNGSYDNSQIRGGIINYHALTDDGTIIGTIHFSRDNGNNLITHTESLSGNITNLSKHELWYSDTEGVLKYRYVPYNAELYFSKTLKVHWTATIFEGPDFWWD